MTSPPTHSLKRRLLWFVLVAILLAAVLQAVTAYQGALRQADALFDDHLQQMARSLRGGVPLGIAQLEDDEDKGFDLFVQIWGPDGTQIFRSTRSACRRARCWVFQMSRPTATSTACTPCKRLCKPCRLRRI